MVEGSQLCDCACHPHNGLVAAQRRYQFGTIETQIGVEPVFCCWCHYPVVEDDDSDSFSETDLRDLCG